MDRMIEKKKSAFSNLVTGERKSSEYGTPLEFFDKLNGIFTFYLDPCAAPDNRLGLPVFFTKEKNAIEREWKQNAFINPPFGTKKGENIRDWIEKMQRESRFHRRNHYVMLLPLRLEANWFQELIMTDKECLIYVIRGRLVFYNPEKNANNDPHPIGSVLYIKGDNITRGMCLDLKEQIPGEFIQVNRSF